MLDPTKVTSFLNILGKWDPSLGFVMLGGIMVTSLGYSFIFKRGKPLFEKDFELPKRQKIDDSKNGDYFTFCRNKKCNQPIYKNRSHFDTRYCDECL